MIRAPLKIVVIGGGIGGLSAAVGFKQAGFDIDLYEQAPELTEVGGGINMGPNAVRVLYRLGLHDGLEREGVRPLTSHQRRWDDGRTLQRASLNPLCEELYGAPHITIHRADLLAVIAAAFPAERVHLGHRLVGIADHRDRVEARFENGAHIEADVVVGADGIHSAVRAALLARRSRNSPAVLPIAGSFRWSALPSSVSKPAISPGSDRARISSIIRSRAGGY